MTASITEARVLRPDIQGLRAIAVTQVVLFHAGVSELSGGFIGVDVFFVISGFLITTQLLRQSRDGNSRLLRTFYARRVMRLLPAATVVLVATVLLARLYEAPLGFASIKEDARATALYFVNFHFAAGGTNYFADTTASPFQHYWSLAVEEQFYLLWPAALVILLWAARRVRWLLAPVVAAGVVGSLLLCVYATDVNQPDAFFLLPTRAWEFGLGALVALGAGRFARGLSPLVASVGAWLGIAMILVAGFWFDAYTPFPGYHATLPAFGAALAIAGGCATRVAVGPSTFLRWRPIQWVGAISYSLYLWHWPLLVVPPSNSTTELAFHSRIALVALAVVLAYMTYRLVENPIRDLKSVRRRPAYAVGVVAICIAVALSCSSLLLQQPRLNVDQVLPVWSANDRVLRVPEPGPVVGSNLTPSLTSARTDEPTLPDATCLADFFTTKIKPCVAGDPDGQRTAVVFGDSHVHQWFPAIDHAARASGVKLVTLLKVACAPQHETLFNVTLGRVYTECDQWRRSAYSYIRDLRPDLVLAGHSLDEHIAQADRDTSKGWAEATTTFANSTVVRGSSLVWIGDSPTFGIARTRCLSAHLEDAAACSAALSEVLNAGRAKAIHHAVLAAEARYIDTSKALCPSYDCAAILGNVLVYRDESHVTATLARRFTPLFSPVFVTKGQP